VVDDRNDEEESRPFDAEQFSRAKDHELLPGVGHLSAAAMMIAAITNGTPE
jgi:hypothetical protein